MNISTLFGILVAALVILFITMTSTENPIIFFNLPSLVIVLGGTIAATLISFPMKEIKRIPKLMSLVFNDKKLDPTGKVAELVSISKLWFKRDVSKIEDELIHNCDPFLKTGIQLVIDKTPTEDILELMNWRIARMKAKEQAEANLFKAMANFAPAFGMVGTIVGLINMMQIMNSHDIFQIGVHIAIAIVSTLYGVLLANFFFKPIAFKLERRTEQRVMFASMVLEGIALMNQRRGPAFINETLKSFIEKHDNDLYDPQHARENAPTSSLYRA